MGFLAQSFANLLRNSRVYEERWHKMASALNRLLGKATWVTLASLPTLWSDTDGLTAVTPKHSIVSRANRAHVSDQFIVFELWRYVLEISALRRASATAFCRLIASHPPSPMSFAWCCLQPLIGRNATWLALVWIWTNGKRRIVSRRVQGQLVALPCSGRQVSVLHPYVLCSCINVLVIFQ